MVAGSSRMTTPPDSDNDSDCGSSEVSFDFSHEMARCERPDAEHHRTSAIARIVKVIIKDAHDTKGPGMTFEVKYLDNFRIAFDCFKAACCNTCRATNEIRFKIMGRLINDDDTPQKVSNIIHYTLSSATNAL